MEKTNKTVVEKRYLLTFVIVTSLFALWGFANDITNPMVAAFQTIMEISAAKASLVQFAFYGGYFTMAIPAALFIRRYSYKSGILLGLALYAIGAFLFIPSALYQEFSFFCLSLYILTFGLAFLETTANPYILSLGSKETSTRRLNFAQAFNPVGSLMGMFVASQFVLANLESDTTEVRELGFSNLTESVKETIRIHDLGVIRDPYVILGCVVAAMFFVILFFVKKENPTPALPTGGGRLNETSSENAISETPSPRGEGRGGVILTLRNLWNNKEYREGVIAQLFYVATQIMNWTFIIQYADRLGIDKATAQMWNIGAMCLNLTGRFVGTYLMKYVNSRLMLTIFALCGMTTIAGVILIDGMVGLYCLVLTSLFMSIMFPTIYGIALEKVAPEDTSLGAAFLVMAIVGGSLLPPVQGWLIDFGTILGWPAVNASFILSFICFLIIAVYGYRTVKSKGMTM